MRLRLRLAVLLVVAVVPFAIGLAFLQGLLVRRNVALATGEAIAGRLDGFQHERCEASPSTWPNLDGPRARRPARARARARRGRGPAGIFVYDASFGPQRPEAPVLSPRLRRALEAGDDVAWGPVPGTRPRDQLLVVARVADEGPCTFVATARPFEGPGLAFTLAPALAVSVFTVLLAVLAAGPLVRRVRRLTDAVRRARAGEGVTIPVDGEDELTELQRAIAADRSELAAKVDALRRRDEALTSFVSNTTHDVMIPLTVLQNHLVTLQSRSEPKSAEAELAGQALGEAHYLGSLLQNLSAAAKLDDVDRPIEHVEVDLADLVERVAQRHRTLAKQKRIELNHACPERLVVQADLTLVERALSNLVHNAIRYGEPGGHVAVVLEPEGEGFRLEVLDDGPGVAEADLARLGERRFRSQEARSRHPSGTGLGLAIAREVAERHGWKLTFEHHEPSGLRVVLEGR
ncbi:MAG: HAMP domain-containing histidine kinase [Sandaracinus sp.]|nr:HAMP domain-containing histidine kinase [Sandaracinus sp.]MCB9614977.1 HAMP domain-containing histidine kinase [Sandaracinus sp.]